MQTMHRTNNFDFLRFLFAIAVIITHSYALSGVGEDQEWLYRITNKQLSFSGLGLSGFFVISGFFIFRSFERSKSFGNYLWKRFLRVFPALFIVLLLSLCVIPFIYESKVPLLLNSSYLTYLPYNLSLYGFQGVVSGVFDKQPYHAINGSLWTIRYEFSLYLAIAFLFLIKKKSKIITALVGFVFILMMLLYHYGLDYVGSSKVGGMLGVHILNLGGFFVAGTLLATLNFERWNSPTLIGISLVIAILAIYFDMYGMVKHLLFSIVVLGIGFIPIKGIRSFSNFGDASYGIYIYAFPIQQLLIYFFKLDIIVFIITSIFISILFGFLSWHLIEKRALKFKSKPQRLIKN